jgi:hypothetical protein
MKKVLFIIPSIIVLFIMIFPSLSNSVMMDQEITKFYIASDYVTTAKLLEQQIKELKEKDLKNGTINFSDLYKKHFLLAHIYAWRLNKPEVALLKYHEVNELRERFKEINKFPPFEFLYIAEIYEKKNDLPKVREYYQNLLKELTAFQDRESDDVSIIMAEDLVKFVKYQIDSLGLKAGTAKDYKPLLKRLKLSGQFSYSIAPYLSIFLVPTAEYDFSVVERTDLSNYIRQSPTDLASMILNYSLVINASAGSVDESPEKVMEAWLSKYPESYYSLQLRYLFYKFHKESGQPKKAEKLLKELEKIANKRGMELIIGPDKRFSSPEKTWETYRNALIAGDVNLAMECYLPGRWQHRKVFTLLGKEKMREIGKRTGRIQRISAGEKEAEYEIIRKENGKEYSYGIYFHNIDGEWKMREF